MQKINSLNFNSSLKVLAFQFLLVGIVTIAQAQIQDKYSNQVFKNTLDNNSDYQNLKKKIIQKYNHCNSGKWGEFVNGVCEDLKTDKKVIALTFDACGGEKGSGYDQELIEYLRKERIPATLFITGRWIDDHYTDFINLAQDTLFEIENHGLNHRPCSVAGRSIYGIKGTANPTEAFDEVEGNARKITALTGKRPHFYRSATAFIDETAATLVRQLGIIPVSYQVLSGDASSTVSKNAISFNVLSTIRPGAIVIMHMNHPQWNTCEALQKIIPELKKKGYHFARLNQFPLTDKKGNS